MYRHGHTGVGLLLYAPVAYVLLSSGRATLAVAGFVSMVWLAMVPDLDTRTRFLDHRGGTHTVSFAVVLGVVCGAGGWLLGPRLAGGSSRVLAGFGFFLGVLVVVAHLLADWLTPMGIAPFWPISSKRYSLGLVSASNAVGNYVLLSLGVAGTAIAVWSTGAFG